LFKAAGLGHRFVLQFLQGVRFIHGQLVAHLDLKPDNIVIRASARLYIIDFSVSVRVPRLDSRLTGYQGTTGWVAPEVKRNPDAGYWPILADLWSTGKVLRYLADHQDAYCSEVRSLADRLQSPEPRHRPLLSTVSLDTLSPRILRRQANPLSKSKRKLGPDAQVKGGVKRKCVQLRP
jgi:serine/threonine protein kinase